MDNGREGFFGVKDFLKSESPKLPETGKLESDARQLIADEYQNMKGLKRYGRSNGLCPYSPYEDLAGNSLRFAEMVQKVKPVESNATRHPFESFYYFYNNELVYQYNKFVELANSGLLKMINQPDIFTFRRLTPQKPDDTSPRKTEPRVEPQVEPRVEPLLKPRGGNSFGYPNYYRREGRFGTGEAGKPCQPVRETGCERGRSGYYNAKRYGFCGARTCRHGICRSHGFERTYNPLAGRFCA
jgi:hypothetical protein